MVITNTKYVFLALGKHLIQALPSVYALQYLTGKVDNNLTTQINTSDMKIIHKNIILEAKQNFYYSMFPEVHITAGLCIQPFSLFDSHSLPCFLPNEIMFVINLSLCTYIHTYTQFNSLWCLHSPLNFHMCTIHIHG